MALYAATARLDAGLPRKTPTENKTANTNNGGPES
jgi:hypothetical protein